MAPVDWKSFQKAARGKTIGVVGDVMLDRYLIGDASRISPEAPVPVVRISETAMRAGGAANVARNVASTGASVRLVSVVGADEAGADLRALLRTGKISASGLVAENGRKTTQKTRVIARNQQVVRLDDEEHLPLPRPLQQRIVKQIRSIAADAWIVSDYGKGLVSDEIMSAVRRSNRPVVVDPVPQNAALYRNATYMTPNDQEASALADSLGVARRGDARLRGIVKSLGLDGLLITLGPRGMELMENGRISRIEAQARQVYDVTGAGDTVISWFTVGIAAGVPAREVMRVANAAAAVVVGKLGTAFADWAEIEAVLEASANRPDAGGG